MFVVTLQRSLLISWLLYCLSNQNQINEQEATATESLFGEKKKKKLYWVAFKSDASTAVLKDEGVI